MSGGGFLPDLANWALRGGAGREDNNNQDDDSSNNNANDQDNGPPLTAEEMRAQRLARMEELQKQQQQEEPEPMDVEEPKNEEKPKASPPPPKPAPVVEVTPKETQKKKRAKADSAPESSARKLQRKKELLLKKILGIVLAGSSTAGHSTTSDCVVVDVEEITTQSIAEILATRLSMPATQKPLIAYLAECHRRASEELKTMQQSSKFKPSEISEILQEIQRQVVSYAASVLMEPDLFEAGQDAPLQLAKCLENISMDLSTSITFGVTGSSSSFYYLLVEELIQQDVSVVDRMVAEIVTHWTKFLTKCESVLDGGSFGSPVVLVSALTALCLHKRAAEAVTKLPQFLLPAAGTPEASQQVRPPLPQGSNILQMLAGQNQPYLKRSGPALEKDTVLGMALRVGIPKNNPAFSPTSTLRQSLNSVESTTSSQRQQLRVHQEACNQLVLSLVKAGPDARSKVMQWFTDALLVNVGASAMRPDPSKVSSTNLLLNVSVVLLKLCDPFVNDPNKQHLIDPGFVSSENDHGGVFVTTGENAVSRLGEQPDDDAMTDSYNPKNSFIPQCFFLCARSLHYGISPLLSYHQNLLRHISHMHYEITTNGRDLHSDPHFTMMVSKQRSNEVALFQEEMVTDTLRFSNLMAKFLFELEDDVLRTMPEDFVSDICDIIVLIARLKAKLLRNVEFRYVFKLVVKLLSAKYAHMVRNYNLRAMLGDVLCEIFLPTTSGDRRDVPPSVCSDPLAGGQTYLLSDRTAQETLAPSLLLLYGEVEQTGYYDKMSHRAKIASLIKYLWDSSEHRPAFRRITQNKESFIKFANGMMNETNTLIATVMQKLPEIREAQEQMRNTEEWGRLTEDQQNQISSRLEDSEREVRHALPLCNKTLQMFGYLNTDSDIRSLFLLDELCSRLVTMLLHVLTKLVGSKGLDLKVDNPEQYEFRPKEMLRDLCAIFALFAPTETFQVECAKSGCDPALLRSAVKTCRRLNLLTGESMEAFESLPELVEKAGQTVAADEELLADAPDEFLDEILSTYMKDPVILPSGHYVDRSTITQHLLNDPIDPFNREPMSVDDIKPATELKEKMNKWLAEKRAGGGSS